MDNAKDLLLIETVVKLGALSKLLIRKGIITDEEIITEMVSISKDLTEQIEKISTEMAKTDSVQ